MKGFLEEVFHKQTGKRDPAWSDFQNGSWQNIKTIAEHYDMPLLHTCASNISAAQLVVTLKTYIQHTNTFVYSPVLFG
jgi:hypothetical protein